MAESLNTVGNERGTMRLDEDALSRQPTIQPFYSTDALLGWRVTLLVQGETAKPLRLEITERAAIGRPDEVDGFMPEIDLTPFNGRDKGVSRRHAEFVVIDNRLHLRDLGSTNGTRLNGQLLYPNRDYRLSDGDLLQFGHLFMVIKLR